jgi:hypothetical protein
MPDKPRRRIMYIFIKHSPTFWEVRPPTKTGIRKLLEYILMCRRAERGGQREAADLRGVDGMKPPKALEQIADVVLSYRPKSKQPKPRKRKKAKRARS